MKSLSITFLSLMMLSACSRTTYIAPKQIQTFFLDDCKKDRIIPNKDGSLNKENHILLKKVMMCHRDRHTFYKKQLYVIGEQ